MCGGQCAHFSVILAMPHLMPLSPVKLLRQHSVQLQPAMVNPSFCHPSTLIVVSALTCVIVLCEPLPCHPDYALPQCAVNMCNSVVIANALNASSCTDATWGPRCTFECDPGYAASDPTLTCDTPPTGFSPAATCNGYPLICHPVTLIAEN